jgi:hypothetical protein
MRLLRWCAVMLLWPIGAAVGQASAGWRTVVMPGTHVRVTQVVDTVSVQFDGVVIAVRGDSLDLDETHAVSSTRATGAQSRTICVCDASRLERSIGSRSAFAAKAKKGAMVGLGIGVLSLVGSLAALRGGGGFAGLAVLASLVAVPAFGAAIGGAGAGQEPIWESVPLSGAR